MKGERVLLWRYAYGRKNILKLIEEDDRWKDHDEIIGVDYAEEYKKQTGRDLATGDYVTQ